QGTRRETGRPLTFSHAERIRLEPRLIQRARTLVDEDHFRLDKLLNATEQDLRQLEQREKELNKLMRENEKLKNEVIRQMQTLLFKQKEKQVNEKVRKKFDAKYTEVGGSAQVGNKVMMKKNHKAGRGGESG